MLAEEGGLLSFFSHEIKPISKLNKVNTILIFDQISDVLQNYLLELPPGLGRNPYQK